MSIQIAIAIGIVMFSIGYMVGRHQQRNIDDQVPVLFIFHDVSDDQCDISTHFGMWIRYDEAEKYKENGGIVVRCRGSEFMYFPEEELKEAAVKDDFLAATINVASKRKIEKKDKNYLAKLASKSYRINL